MIHRHGLTQQNYKCVVLVDMRQLATVADLAKKKPYLAIQGSQLSSAIRSSFCFYRGIRQNACPTSFLCLHKLYQPDDLLRRDACGRHDDQ